MLISVSLLASTAGEKLSSAARLMRARKSINETERSSSAAFSGTFPRGEGKEITCIISRQLREINVKCLYINFKRPFPCI